MKKLVSQNLNEFARQYMDKPIHHPDLSKQKGSVTANLEALIGQMEGYSDIEQLKDDLYDILEASSISKEKMYRYAQDLDGIRDMRRLQEFITNIYLKGSKLGLT